jgi:hypothetical protein
MAASAKQAGEMILAKRFIWFLPVVFDSLASTHRNSHYSGGAIHE